MSRPHPSSLTLYFFFFDSPSTPIFDTLLDTFAFRAFASARFCASVLAISSPFYPFFLGCLLVP